MLKKLLKISAFKIVLIITGIICMIVISDVDLGYINDLELKSRDLRFQIRGVEKPSGKVVVVAIDDRSIEMLGRWPWPRLRFAQLIAVLHKAGVAVTGFDLLFTEHEENPEMSKIRELAATFQELGLLDASGKSQAFFEELVDASEGPDNDAVLASVAMETGKVVFALAFVPLDEPPEDFDSFMIKAAYESFQKMEKIDSYNLISLHGRLLPIPILGEAATGLGFVNFIPDGDGAMRRGIVALESGGALFAPLSVRIAQQYLNMENEDITVNFDGRIEIGPYIIPMDTDCMCHINYYGPNETIPYYSFADVLTGKVPPETFKGKAAIVGGAAVGLGDMWPNPFVRSFWGVEAQATIVDNILSQNFLKCPGCIKYINTAIVLFIGLVLGIFSSRINMRAMMCLCLAAVVVFVTANQYIFVKQKLILLFVLPLIEITLIYTAVSAYKYFTEEREKRKIKGAFQQYMNPAVVNQVLEHPDMLKLGGENKELSVLFSDIRRFTTISEGMTPENLVKFMNEYLTAMTNIVLAHNGTLDKYIGDALMAIYGAPVYQEDHAMKACCSAINMFKTLYDIHSEWAKQGFPEVHIGIGINTGNMIVGNMGSEKRFDYTVMGDNVNLGSRLEGLTKRYGVQIIISEFTYEKIKKDLVCRELDLVRVKGKKKPVRIYELFSGDYFSGGAYTFVPPFEKGLERYRKKKWNEAIGSFNKVLVIKPDDKPTELFISRCIQMQDSPPPQDWDGVFIAKEK